MAPLGEQVASVINALLRAGITYFRKVIPGGRRRKRGVLARSKTWARRYAPMPTLRPSHPPTANRKAKQRMPNRPSRAGGARPGAIGGGPRAVRLALLH